MTWVKAENARTAKVLEADPHYRAYFDAALKVAEDPARLAVPNLRGGEVYNQWRDASNPRGLLRKTTVADYLSEHPHWTPVIDYDALGKTEKRGLGGAWIELSLPGRSVLPGEPFGGRRRCGEHARVRPEARASSSAMGSHCRTASRRVAWVDKDTLLVERDWGAGTMTSSGYPFVVKEWKRGTPLESAKELFRGAATDQVGSRGRVLQDAQGDRLEVFSRGVTFFESETSVRTPRGRGAAGDSRRSRAWWG